MTLIKWQDVFYNEYIKNEKQHFLISGGVGAGKSFVINHIAQEEAKKDNKVVIYNINNDHVLNCNKKPIHKTIDKSLKNKKLIDFKSAKSTKINLTDHIFGEGYDICICDGMNYFPKQVIENIIASMSCNKKTRFILTSRGHEDNILHRQVSSLADLNPHTVYSIDNADAWGDASSRGAIPSLMMYPQTHK